MDDREPEVDSRERCTAWKARDPVTTLEYRGYQLSTLVLPGDEGYRVSVAIVRPALGGVRSQRFLDVGVFAQRAEARREGIAQARAWVDEELTPTRRVVGTDFLPLV